MTKFFNGVLAKIRRVGSVEQEGRKPLVSSKYVARWSKAGDEFSVQLLGSTGPAEIVVRLVERQRNWTSNDAGSGAAVRSEISWHVLVARGEVETEVAELPGSERQRAQAEFARITEGLVAEYFGAIPSVPPSQTASAGPVRSWPRRFARSIGPWVGGGALVIAFSLFMTAQNTSVASVAAGGSAPGLEPNGLARAPEAWNALSQAQRDTLLKMTAAAADQVANEQRAALALAGKASPVTGSPASPVQAPVGSKLTPSQMKTLLAAPSLKVGKGSKTLYAFEDPLCGACQHFASQAQSLDASFGLVVIPIGFQPGGRDKAAAALCAADPAAAWSVAMRGLPVDGKPCDAGYKKVDQNNAMFSAFGLSSTPTLVAPNAALVAGSGDTAEIAGWVDRNTK